MLIYDGEEKSIKEYPEVVFKMMNRPNERQIDRDKDRERQKR